MERPSCETGRIRRLDVVAFLLIVTTTSSILVKALSASDDRHPLTPALYVFGDSVSDAGNNNYLQTLAKANVKPYGLDFVGGPTGRFTNGKLVVDFLAEKLHLPSPPPYLRLLKENKLGNTTTGVNYASSSCGILDQTGSNLGECLSLKKQIIFFKKTKWTMASAFKSKENLAFHLAKSVFIINIGSNDYINNYLQDSFNTSALYTPNQFAIHLHRKLYAAIKKLYLLGARKFVVYNIGLIGCTPRMRATRNGACVKPANKLVLPFNQMLPSTIKKLKSALNGIAIVHQRHNPLNSRTAIKFGIKHVDIPCCPCCIPPAQNAICNIAPCSNRDDYAYWDIFHPTQKIYSIMAELCFDKWSSNCDSYSIKQLAKL